MPAAATGTSTTDAPTRRLAGDARAAAAHRLGRAPAFAAASVAMVAITAAAGAPSPLLIVYQERYGIPDAGLTGALVAYILPAAVALLCCGRLSDHLGRRPVALGALGSGVAGCLALIAVRGLPILLVGRALQGVATGLGLSALGAYVVDLRPRRRAWLAAAVTSGAPAGGLALGAVVSGALVQYGPAPRTLVYLGFAVVLTLSALGVLAAPETSRRSPGAIRSLKPAMTIPAGAAAIFAAACCCFVAAWALGSFYQALGPSLAARVLDHDGHLFGGLVVASVMGTSALGGPLTNRLGPRTSMLGGSATLAVATVAVLAALRAESTIAFLVSSVIAGLGFGAAFNGGMRRLLDMTPPADRAGALSAAYFVSYFGAAIPSFAAGLLTGPWGLTTVTDAYGALVLVLILIAIGVSGRSVVRVPSNSP